MIETLNREGCITLTTWELRMVSIYHFYWWLYPVLHGFSSWGINLKFWPYLSNYYEW